MKGIKKLKKKKKTSNSVSAVVNENNITLTKPEDIANAFIKNFINISSKIQCTIKSSRGKFYDFLPDIDINYFFIKLADKIKIQNIIFIWCFSLTPKI